MQQIVVISDLHIGSVVSLWAENVPLEGGGRYVLNKYQRWLQTCWEDFLAHIVSLSQKPVLVINGDTIQGISYKDGQLISNKPDIQALAAEEILKPLVRACSRLIIVRGTEWHEGRCSEFVEQLAKSLGAEPHHATGQYTRWETHLEMAGRVIHFAHHVQSSSVPWYEATVPLRDTLLQLSELWRFYGPSAPNLSMVVRSHRHRYIHVDAPPNIQVVVTPAWQLKTAFAYKKAASMLPQIGYVIIGNGDNGLTIDRKIYQLAPIHVEKIDG